MTAGHRHHHLALRQSSRLLRWGQKPLAITINRKKAENSRWVWREVRGETRISSDGKGNVRIAGYERAQYHLTTLGILHTLTGLVVVALPDEDGDVTGV